jgi:hypothetical protein
MICVLLRPDKPVSTRRDRATPGILDAEILGDDARQQV